MGEINDLPLFFDCANSGYIFPNEQGGIEYKNNLCSIIKPIIVGDQNIVNIVDGSGVGVIDFCQDTYDRNKCDFDEVTIELKVNLKKGEHTEERIYQIPNGRFESGDVVDLGDWI